MCLLLFTTFTLMGRAAQTTTNCRCGCLCRTLFLLMQHQDVAARLVKEVDGVVGDTPPGQCFTPRLH
jgi:hypothetical protein